MKKSSTKNDQDKKPKRKVSNKPKHGPREENDAPFNFGGLPQRDLKKNLGCG
jgi:hypothetical protein